jgi:hypothetical protein
MKNNVHENGVSRYESLLRAILILLASTCASIVYADPVSSDALRSIDAEIKAVVSKSRKLKSNQVLLDYVQKQKKNRYDTKAAYRLTRAYLASRSPDPKIRDLIPEFFRKGILAASRSLEEQRLAVQTSTMAFGTEWLKTRQIYARESEDLKTLYFVAYNCCYSLGPSARDIELASTVLAKLKKLYPNDAHTLVSAGNVYGSKAWDSKSKTLADQAIEAYRTALSAKSIDPDLERWAKQWIEIIREESSKWK